MPSASEILKKHEARVKGSIASKPRIERKGPTRPWQEDLESYAETKPRESKPSPERGGEAAGVREEAHGESVSQSEAALPSEGQIRSQNEFVASSHESFDGSLPNSRLITSPEVSSALIEAREGSSATGAEALVVASRRPHEGPRVAYSTSLTSNALQLIQLISKHGFDLTMKFILVRELANADGLIQCSQQFLAGQLNVNLKSVKRLFNDLCEANLIVLAKEADMSTKAAREYRVLLR